MILWQIGAETWICSWQRRGAVRKSVAMASSVLHALHRSWSFCQTTPSGAAWLTQQKIDAWAGESPVRRIVDAVEDPEAEVPVTVALEHQPGLLSHYTLQLSSTCVAVVWCHVGSGLAPPEKVALPCSSLQGVAGGCGWVRRTGTQTLVAAMLYTDSGLQHLVVTLPAQGAPSLSAAPFSIPDVLLAGHPEGSPLVLSPGSWRMTADARLVGVQSQAAPHLVVLHRQSRGSRHKVGSAQRGAANASLSFALVPVDSCAAFAWHSGLPGVALLTLSTTGSVSLWHEGPNDEELAFVQKCTVQLSSASSAEHPGSEEAACICWLQSTLGEDQFCFEKCSGWVEDGHLSSSSVLPVTPRGQRSSASEMHDSLRLSKHCIILWRGGLHCLHIYNMYSSCPTIEQVGTVCQLPSLPPSVTSLHALSAAVPLSHQHSSRPLPFLACVEGGSVLDQAGALSTRYDTLADVSEVASNLVTTAIQHAAGAPPSTALGVQQWMATQCCVPQAPPAALDPSANMLEVAAASMRAGVLPEQELRPEDVAVVLAGGNCAQALRWSVAKRTVENLWDWKPMHYDCQPLPCAPLRWASLDLEAQVLGSTLQLDVAVAGTAMSSVTRLTHSLPATWMPEQAWLQWVPQADAGQHDPPLLLVACPEHWRILTLVTRRAGTLGIRPAFSGEWQPPPTAPKHTASRQWACIGLSKEGVLLLPAGTPREEGGVLCSFVDQSRLAAALSQARSRVGALQPAAMQMLVRCGQAFIVPRLLSVIAAGTALQMEAEDRAQSLCLPTVFMEEAADPALGGPLPREELTRPSMGALFQSHPQAAAVAFLADPRQTHSWQALANEWARRGVDGLKWAESSSPILQHALSQVRLTNVAPKQSLDLFAFVDQLYLCCSTSAGAAALAGTGPGVGLSLDYPARVAAWGMLGLLHTHPLAKAPRQAVGQQAAVPWSPFRALDAAWACLSECKKQLLTLVIRTCTVQLGASGWGQQGGDMLWWQARACALPVWLTDAEDVQTMLASIARAEYTHSQRNPYVCLLWYVLQGPSKLSVAAALLKRGVSVESTGLPGGVSRKDVKAASKIGDFIRKDFTTDKKARKNALSNAMGLLAVHRYHLAIAFMLLAGEVSDAASIAMHHANDPELALLVHRQGAVHFAPASVRESVAAASWIRVLPRGAATGAGTEAYAAHAQDASTPSGSIFDDFEVSQESGAPSSIFDAYEPDMGSGGVFGDFDAAPEPHDTSGGGETSIFDEFDTAPPVHESGAAAAEDVAAAPCEAEEKWRAEAATITSSIFPPVAAGDDGVPFARQFVIGVFEQSLVEAVALGVSACSLESPSASEAAVHPAEAHLLEHALDSAAFPSVTMEQALAATCPDTSRARAKALLSGLVSAGLQRAGVAAGSHAAPRLSAPEHWAGLLEASAEHSIADHVPGMVIAPDLSSVLSGLARAVTAYTRTLRTAIMSESWATCLALLRPCDSTPQAPGSTGPSSGICASSKASAIVGHLTGLLVALPDSAQSKGTAAWPVLRLPSGESPAQTSKSEGHLVFMSLLSALVWRHAAARVQQLVRVASRASPRICAALRGGLVAPFKAHPDSGRLGRMTHGVFSVLSQAGDGRSLEAAAAEEFHPDSPSVIDELVKGVTVCRAAFLDSLAHSSVVGVPVSRLLEHLVHPTAFGGRARTLGDLLCAPASGLRLADATALDALWSTVGGPHILWELAATLASASGSERVPALRSWAIALHSVHAPIQLVGSTASPATARAPSSGAGAAAGVSPSAESPQHGLLGVPRVLHTAPSDFHSCVAVHPRIPGYIAAACSSGVIRLEVPPTLHSGSTGQSLTPPSSPVLSQPSAFLPSFLPLCFSPMAPRAGIVAREDTSLVVPLDSAVVGRPLPSLGMGSSRLSIANLNMGVLPVGQMPHPAAHQPGLSSFLATPQPGSASITSKATVTRVKMHPHFPAYVTGGAAGQVILWEGHQSRGHARFNRHSVGAEGQPVETVRTLSVDWDPLGDRIAAVFDDQHLAVWDAHRTTNPVYSLTLGMRSAAGVHFMGGPHCLAVCGKATRAASPGGSLTATSPFANLQVFDTRAAGMALGAALPGSSLTCLALSSRSSTVFLGTEDGAIQGFDLRSLKCPVATAPTSSHSKAVTAIAMFSDEHTIVSGGSDGLVQVWQPTLGRPVQRTRAFESATFVNHKLSSSFFSSVGVTDLSFGAGLLVAAGASGKLMAYSALRHEHGMPLAPAAK